MSIQTENLTKIYGNQKALDGISFEARPGEILGFLGPNGAGKSTTMKILTCFLPQTSGKAMVCGYDVVEHPVEVRRRIGYLPELNPLYTDMYIKEYLMFSAEVQGIKKDAASRVGEMIERVGLEQERKKKIGQLSKGYKQRVGLAQAMLHNPSVLILDEPTSGLDPNQVVEIRELIRQIGKDKTVLFSTHIMQEVEALCDRVVIINKGKIVANDRLDNLFKKLSGDVTITVEFKQEIPLSALKQLSGVKQITQKKNRYTLQCQGDLREAISNLSGQQGWVLLGMNLEENTLEEVFQKLTLNP
ncbi:MAG: gliding motility-associated ABC transporter ATP-binding subunit GldA [Bacteroidia bacterium]|jgi:ABC-2 type transport system ATP-binding protein